MSRGTKLQVASFGPFRGIAEAANPDSVPAGMLRRARFAALTGTGRLVRAPGLGVVLTLLDDQGTPAACTTVCAVAEFGSGLLLVGHSEATSKVYLYTATATGSSLTRVGVLWTGVATPPTVTVAEILGTAYLASDQAFGDLVPDFPALTHAVQTWDGTTVAPLTANLDGTGALPVYALGVAAFQSHLVTWGYDQGAVAATAYRPEYLRLGGPNGDPLDSAGKAAFGVGHRVRSPRDGIQSVCVVGDVCYVGTASGLWALTGYGRDTWQVTALEDRAGVVGRRAMVGAAGACYYWSERGPMRARGLTAPDALYDAIADTAAAATTLHRIVAAYDADRAQVQFYHGAATEKRAAFDVRRQAWLGPDDAVGASVFCAASVTALAPQVDAATYVGTSDSPQYGHAGTTGGRVCGPTVDTTAALDVATWDATPAGAAGACVWRQITLTHRVVGASGGAPVTWTVTPYVDGVALAAQVVTRTSDGTFAEEFYLAVRGARLRVEATLSANTAAVELIDLTHHVLPLSSDP
jgi:hypothetical protein